MGLGRIELPTSPLSGVRSSQLSYRPGLNSRSNSGGAGRDRTGDLLNANQALSQLSYSPSKPLITQSSRGQLDAGMAQGACRKRKTQRRTKWRMLKHRHLLAGTFRPADFKWSATAATYFLISAPLRSRFSIRSVTAPTFSLRKEVIQPQVLLRLPCYDFTPIMSHTLGRSSPCGLGRRLLVQPTFVM